jgi:hypothetical protein
VESFVFNGLSAISFRAVRRMPCSYPKIGLPVTMRCFSTPSGQAAPDEPPTIAIPVLTRSGTIVEYSLKRKIFFDFLICGPFAV